MPIHHFWQVKKVISFESLCCVDHAACFASRGFQILIIAFMGLVMWVTLYVYSIDHLKDYVDDIFSFEWADWLLYYPPYQAMYPARQACLLQLWDDLGIPHDQGKQEFGPVLHIIRLEVDPNSMTVTMDINTQNELNQLISNFVVAGRKCTLIEFQCIAGHMNWAFNIFPLLKPGLSAIYLKMAEKNRDLSTIRVNTMIAYELSWVACRISY